MYYNQYPIGHYELEVKAPGEGYGTKMYKMLQDSEREIKEIGFDSNDESLKQEYPDIFEGVKSLSCIQLSVMKIVTYRQNTYKCLR